MIKEKDFIKRLTLLFVKDSTHFYDEWLQEKFGSVKFAYNCKEAIDKFDKYHIDIILVELEDNQKDKFELINKVKKIDLF